MKKLTFLFAVTGLLQMTACQNDKYVDTLPVVKNNVSFSTDIQPILTTDCANCHNPGNMMMSKGPDLRVGHAYDALTSGDGIVPGDSESSELMEMLEGGGDNPMPPGSKMSPLKIALIKKWIDEGAKNN